MDEQRGAHPDQREQWQAVIDNPLLQDLPFKFELNKWGKIEMSPASNRHGKLQGEIYAELSKKRNGTAIVECSVQTSNGVRVADVAWLSKAKNAEFGDQTPYPEAPEICVEIMSPSNSWGEMHMKAGLYLEAGAKEVWIQPIDGERLVIKPQVSKPVALKKARKK
jgi:Uma2 family endonuclease